jgi:hypothetical protein
MAGEDKPGKPISKDEFEKMRKAYDSKNPKKTKSVLYSLESVQRVLSTPGVAGLRIFYGIDDDGNDTVMLAPTDATGATMYTTLEDRGQLCPPYCP